MRIQPIVEGYGEVAAVPILLRRLRDELGAFHVECNRPIRRTRWELVNESSLRKSIRLALLQDECTGILILFDGDDDCPKKLAPTIEGWAQDEAREVPCRVVIAQREYEAWFLSAIESLRGARGIPADAGPPPVPEDVRDAKGALGMYVATTDQAAFTARFDLATAYRRSRSFRRMVRAFGLIVASAGRALPEWPPPHWRVELPG